MNSFMTMGEAMLLAREGQQEIARALVDALSRGLAHLMQRTFRRTPRATHAPE